VAELLVPFFLAEIGLHFDLKVFEDPRVVVLAALLLPVAVISKSCSDAVWARVPKLDWRSERSAPIRGSIIVFMAVAAATMSPALLKWSFRAVLTSDPATETSEVSGDNLW